MTSPDNLPLWKQKLYTLKQTGLTLYVENNNTRLFESRDPMLFPLYQCLTEHREDMAGSIVVDKIVGGAAAYLCALGKVSQVITPTVSEPAIHIFRAYNIRLYAERIIPFVINRQGTGLCPMEKLSRQFDDPEAFFEHLKMNIFRK